MTLQRLRLRLDQSAPEWAGQVFDYCGERID
jgi:hypothetical protein